MLEFDVAINIYLGVFIPSAILFVIGAIYIGLADKHLDEVAKKKNSINRILNGEGYSAEGLKYQKVGLKFLKFALVGFVLIVITFVYLVNFTIFPNKN